MNYFELFDLPVAPSVDKNTVQKKYFELQKKFHPDFYTGATENEQDEVLQQSADVNKAYNIFKDSDKTIEYYLRVSGIITEDEKFELPSEFLMEMMELNETLTDNPDAAAKEIAAYEEKLNKETFFIVDMVSMGNADGRDLEKLKGCYYRKKYLYRILDRLAD